MNQINDYRVARGHELAATAARGALLAHRHGRFWTVHDALFTARHELTRTRIVDILAAAGIHGDEVESALDGTTTDAVLKQHIALARELEVAGTPTLYVNGRRMGGFNASMLDLVLRHELRHAGLDLEAGIRDGSRQQQ